MDGSIIIDQSPVIIGKILILGTHMISSNFFIHVGYETSMLSAILSIFLVFAVSVSLAALLIEERKGLRILLSIFITLSMLTILYIVHDGVRSIISIQNLISWRKILFYTTLYVSVIYFILKEIPENWSKERTPERVQVWSAIAMAFHISLNMLRKRRLRTILVILTMLSISIALTCFMSIDVVRGTIVSLTRMKANVRSPMIGLKGSREAYREVLSEDIIRNAIVYERVYTPPQSEPILILYNPKKDTSVSLFGIIAIDPSKELLATPMDETIVKGEFLEDNDYKHVLIGISQAKILKANPGDELILKSKWGFEITHLIVKGIFEEEKLDGIYDSLGSVKPEKYIPRDTSGFQKTLCRADEVIIVVKGRVPVYMIPRGFLLIFRDENTMYKAAEAISRELRIPVVVAVDGYAKTITVGRILQVKGISTLIVVVLGGLVMMISMLSSVYERRNEFKTYSAIGLNPDDIKYLSLAEALIIGFIGGGIGYISGLLISYLCGEILNLEGFVLSSSQLWGVGSVIITVLISTLSSLYPIERASLEVVPSMERKWRLKGDLRREFTIPLPFRIPVGKEKNFITFVKNRLEAIYPPYSTLLRCLVLVKSIDDNEFLIRINADLVSEGMSSAILELRGYRKSTKYFTTSLRVIPVSVTSSKYVEFIYSIVDDIRKIVLKWLTLYS